MSTTTTEDVEIFDVVPMDTTVMDYIANFKPKSRPPKIGEYLYYDSSAKNNDAQSRAKARGGLRRGSGNGLWREEIPGCPKYVCRTDKHGSCGGDFSLPVNIDCKYSGWINHGKLIMLVHTHKDPKPMKLELV